LADSKKSNVDATHPAQGRPPRAAFGDCSTQRTSAGAVEITDKVLDFMTNADVEKAEQKVSSCSIVTKTNPAPPDHEDFRKEFPKINTSYVRAQTGAPYTKILSERSAGPFDVERHNTIRPAPGRFPEEGGYEHYVSPETPAYKADHLSFAGWSFFLDASTPAGCLQLNQGLRRGTPRKTWPGHLNPRWKGLISCKIPPPVAFVQWYTAAQAVRAGFWERVRQAESARVRFSGPVVR